MESDRIAYKGLSDAGLVRKNNEDAFAVDVREGAWPLLFVVADGLGGHRHGEIASLTAVDFILSYLREQLPVDNHPEAIRKSLEDAIQKTNVKVYLKSLETKENEGMGTTMTLTALYDQSCFVAHIGDSRLYRMRDGVLEKMTSDHTYVNEMVAMGKLTEEESVAHPKRHILTQALGYPEYVRPEILHLDLKPEDRLLLATDGLHGFLPFKAIEKTLKNGRTPQDVVSSLIEQVLREGAPDNVTALVVFA